jgi:hypothetical protein
MPPDAAQPPILIALPPEALERWTRQMQSTESEAREARRDAAEARAEAASARTAIAGYATSAEPIFAEWRAEQAARAKVRADNDAKATESEKGWKKLRTDPRVVSAVTLIVTTLAGLLIRASGLDPGPSHAAQDAPPTAQEAPR